MSLPSSNSNGQSSIRNFFQPKSPSYAPPPAMLRTPATSSTTAPPPPPPAARPPPITGQNGSKSPSLAATANVPPPRPSSLHPQATIAPILPEYIPALRRITSLLLPVNYPDSFYQRLSDPLSSGAFSRVLLWTDPSDANGAPKVIGGLVCRPELNPFTPSSAPTKPNALYIQSLVLLSPYRSLGLAAALLDEIAQLASNSQFACEEVYAHVWTDNEDGLRWYLARGFAKYGEIQGYYFKLKPDSAWIVRRKITPSSSPSPSPNSHSLNSTLPSIPQSTTTAAANLPPISLQPTQPQATPPLLSASTLSPPPRSAGPSPNRSPAGTPGVSYQNARPETEWNDLPADMHAPPPTNGSAPGSSAASSRSSSAAPRKKRDRAYPAAAFGK